MAEAINDRWIAKSLEESLDSAAEELISGDSDDPPLSGETVAEMLRLSRFYRSHPLRPPI